MHLWGIASQWYLLGGTRHLLGGTWGPLSNLYKSRGGTEGPLKNLLRSGVRNLWGTEGSLGNFLRSGVRNLRGTEGPLENLLSCGGRNLWRYGGRNLIRFITYMNLRHPGSNWTQDFNVLIVLTFNPICRKKQRFFRYVFEYYVFHNISCSPYGFTKFQIPNSKYSQIFQQIYYSDGKKKTYRKLEFGNSWNNVVSKQLLTTQISLKEQTRLCLLQKSKK